MFGIVLGDYGAPSLVAAFVIAILVGALIPRWTYNKTIKDKDATIAYLRAALDKRDEQMDKLFATGELTVRLLEDLKKQATNVSAERRTS